MAETTGVAMRAKRGVRGYFTSINPKSAMAILMAAFCLAGCASTPEPQYDASHKNSRTRPEDRKETFGDAISAPLEDLNLKKRPIPPILLAAMQNPYDMTGLERCEQIAAEVSRLDEVLGFDYDEPPAPDDRTLAEKGGRMANDAAVGAVKGAARSVIPFRGIVRQVSGAESHAKQMENAIAAGRARRAYLKGVGMNMNCAPPAAPSWFKPRVYIEPDPATKKKPKANTPKSRRTSRKH